MQKFSLRCRQTRQQEQLTDRALLAAPSHGRDQSKQGDGNVRATRVKPLARPWSAAMRAGGAVPSRGQDSKILGLVQSGV